MDVPAELDLIPTGTNLICGLRGDLAWRKGVATNSAVLLLITLRSIGSAEGQVGSTLTKLVLLLNLQPVH